MTPEWKEEVSVDTPRARTKMVKTRPKGKVESKDESDDTPKGINWKLIRAMQKYQKEQKKDFGFNGASPLLKEILAKTFSTKFKLPILDKYDGIVDPKSYLAIFRTTM